MKESIGYTVSLNIVITFIVIVFAFLSAALIYFKSNKVSNVITDTIEKYEGYYEGYNNLSKTEIQMKLSSIGYNRKNVNCQRYYNRISDKERNDSCTLALNQNGSNYGLTNGSDGYCVFVCREYVENEWYYYYKISTNLMFNIPIINDVLDIPIFSNTNRLYDFEENL